MNGSDEQVGVFICHCGGNISDNVNIESLKKSISTKDIKVFDYEYLCSNLGQDLIKRNIEEHNLERVVIGSCTPSKHEKLFKRCAEQSGINQSFLEIANLREQCSWVHPEAGDATEKAESLIRAKIERTAQARPLEDMKIPIHQSSMVVGAGIAGINAALNLARNGIDTYLVEKDVTIGGKAAKIGKIFSPEKLAEECAMCSLSPLMNEVASHPKIELISHCEVEDVGAGAGNFEVALRKKPRYVKDSCVACGKCTEVCPVNVENDFNCGVKDKKAISLRFAQAVPQIYSIDPEYCIKLRGGKCGRCQDVCSVDAIDFEQQDETLKLNVGAIIAATGFEEYDAKKKSQYGYGRFENVLTQMDLARILGVNGPTHGKLARPSDWKKPESIVMIQCVGSRDEKPTGNKYCSRYCCMAALKHASLIKKKYPDTDITICYIDIRAFGLYENYYRAVQDIGVSFLRGRPAEVVQKKDRSLVVKVEDTLAQKLREIPADLVVLSTAMEASPGTKDVAQKLNTTLSEDGFIKEKHSKLKPVDTSREGIFVCGTAQSPKDITDTIAQAGLAASRTQSFIAKGEITIDPEIAQIDMELCNDCTKCLKCPFDAISMEGEKVNIDPIMCNGCGYCTILCEKDAISVAGYTPNEIIAEIQGLTQKGDAIVFANRNIAYSTVDNIGNSAEVYPSEVKIIRVPTTTLINRSMIDLAFDLGATSVMMVEDPTDNQIGEFIYPLARENFENMKEQMGKRGERMYLKKAYIPHYRGLSNAFTDIAENTEVE